MHRKCECLCVPLSTPCMFPGFVLSSGHVTYEGAGSDQTPEAAGCSVLVTSRSARGQARCELFLPSPKPSFLSHAKCLMRVPGMGEYWGWKPSCWRSCQCRMSLWAAPGPKAFWNSSTVHLVRLKDQEVWCSPEDRWIQILFGYSVTNPSVSATGWIGMMSFVSSL